MIILGQNVIKLQKQFPQLEIAHTHTCIYRERDRETEKERKRKREKRERERERETHTHTHREIMNTITDTFQKGTVPLTSPLRCENAP